MMFFIALFLVATVAAVVAGTTRGVMSNSGLNGVVLGGFLFVAIIMLPSLFSFYKNDIEAPAAQWEDEFGEPMQSGIVLVEAKTSISVDRYRRFFTVLASTSDIRAFAARHNFLELSETEKLERINLEFQSRESGLKQPCDSYLEFEALVYRGERTDLFDTPSVWIRHCPSNKETYIHIIL